jgi:hypothetical protein
VTGRALSCSGFAVLGVAAVLAGCGSSDPGGRVQAENARKALQLVGAADVARQPQGSPFRALLEWWRSAQYRDPAGALDHFSAAERQQVSHDFATLLYRDFGPWLQRVKPKLQTVEEDGDHATLFLRLTVRDVVSPAVVRDVNEFVAIPMVRERGQWRVADATFYEQNAARQRDARVAAQQRVAAATGASPRRPTP